MKTQALSDAIYEAKRFLVVAMIAEKAVKKSPSLLFGPSKTVAAAKRSSMDLTRALAEMRKP